MTDAGTQPDYKFTVQTAFPNRIPTKQIPPLAGENAFVIIARLEELNLPISNAFFSLPATGPQIMRAPYSCGHPKIATLSPHLLPVASDDHQPSPQAESVGNWINRRHHQHRSCTPD